MIKQLLNILTIPPYKTDGTTLRAHAPFLYWLLHNLRPKIFVEYGVFRGDNFYTICNKVKQLGLNTRCFAVDSWNCDPCCGVSDEMVYQHFMEFYNKKEFVDLITIIRANGDEALSQFEDNSINLLHIDACHQYKSVRNDFDKWLPKMSKKNGIMLFHDVCAKTHNFEVWKLWEEESPKYPHFLWPHSYGLGMLVVGEIIPSEIRNLVELPPADVAIIQRAFEKLGIVIFET